MEENKTLLTPKLMEVSCSRHSSASWDKNTICMQYRRDVWCTAATHGNRTLIVQFATNCITYKATHFILQKLKLKAII